MEVKAPSRHAMRMVATELQALRLRTSVRLGERVAVIGFLAEPNAAAIADDFSWLLEELQKDYGVTVATNDDQLRWALEQMAGDGPGMSEWQRTQGLPLTVQRTATERSLT